MSFNLSLLMSWSRTHHTLIRPNRGAQATPLPPSHFSGWLKHHGGPALTCLLVPMPLQDQSPTSRLLFKPVGSLPCFQCKAIIRQSTNNCAQISCTAIPQESRQTLEEVSHWLPFCSVVGGHAFFNDKTLTVISFFLMTRQCPGCFFCPHLMTFSLTPQHTDHHATTKTCPLSGPASNSSVAPA